MDGRAFLDVSKELLVGPTEAHWRAAAGRAYYALMLEGWAALLRWGFAVPPRDSVHTFVRMRFNFAADRDLQKIGRALDSLSWLRNQADYHLASPGPFTDSVQVGQGIGRAETSLVRLDQVEADTSRRAAAITGIRSKFP
jgi:hypothetical protein